MGNQATPRTETWDLTALYLSSEDPAWTRDLQAAADAADKFRKNFRQRISAEDLTAGRLAAALAEYQQLQAGILKPYLYAQLLFSRNSEPVVVKALLARARETWSEISEQTLFFELEILQLDEARFNALVKDPDVAEFRHYLEQCRVHAPYTLNEEVEQVLKRKDLSGREAFVQLFDELSASLRYRFLMPDESVEREVTGEELLGLLYHGDREVRERSFATFLNKHAEQQLVLTTCFNNILLDHGKESELRQYPDLMTATHLSSETDPIMVEQMMRVTEANYPLARDYFALKRQLLGYEELKNTDLYAPVGGTGKAYPFTEAKQLVLESFGSFAPELANLAEAFFRDKRIDVYPAPGKSGGAFCMPMMPGYQPYLLLNYTGSLRDVSTLAHEMGHGLHSVLAQQQNLFHYQAPLPFAETASVFGEMLLTRHLLDADPDRQVKISLLCSKLEDIIATTFRQNLLTRFELAAHRKRAEGLLSAEDLCELWWSENAKLFGDKVQMNEPYRWGWSYISHFIHSRFYCYSYVFGELLVLALYQKYLEEGEAFVPKYLELLARGGSDTPRNLLAPLGIDLTDPDFWQKGYDFVSSLLRELKELLAEQHADN
jgi:oligoendopeptidase F